MATIRVDVDLADVFSEISDDELTQEMIDRFLETPRLEEEEVMDKIATFELLRDCSEIVRKSGKVNLALGLDNLIEELQL